MLLIGEIKNNQAMVNIQLEGVAGLGEVRVVLDTGFNGELMLTYKTIATLQLDLLGQQGFFVASGDYVETDFYRGILPWFGNRRIVGVLATNGDHNLLGMDLLSDCIVTIDMPQKKINITT